MEPTFLDRSTKTFCKEIMELLKRYCCVAPLGGNARRAMHSVHRFVPL